MNRNFTIVLSCLLVATCTQSQSNARQPVTPATKAASRSTSSEKTRSAADKKQDRIPTTSGPAAKATENRFKDVDAAILESISTKQIPGAVLVIGHKGQIVYRKAYGRGDDARYHL
jgi:CubicO group peptidase (beta-lactamase class C family)